MKGGFAIINNRERIYQQMTLSDINVIKFLILYRSKIDKTYKMKQNYHPDQAGDSYDFNTELLCLYADLEELMKETDLTSEQLDIINYLERGYTYLDIADILGESSAEGVELRFNTICKAIQKTNYDKWLVWATFNYVKSEWKTCRVCRENLPLNDYFYGADTRNKDGFKGICKKCENYTKKLGN